MQRISFFFFFFFFRGSSIVSFNFFKHFSTSIRYDPSLSQKFVSYRLIILTITFGLFFSFLPRWTSATRIDRLAYNLHYLRMSQPHDLRLLQWFLTCSKLNPFQQYIRNMCLRVYVCTSLRPDNTTDITIKSNIVLWNVNRALLNETIIAVLCILSANRDKIVAIKFLNWL